MAFENRILGISITRFFFATNGFPTPKLSEAGHTVHGMNDPLQLITTAVDQLAGQDPQQLPDLLVLEHIEELLVARDRIDGLLAARRQVADRRGATDAEYGRKTRSWLVEDRRLCVEQANRYLTVAKALPLRPVVAAALLAGDINLDHARNIVVSVAKVPADLQDVVEKELVTAAESVDPTSVGAFARELRSRLGAEDSTQAAEQRRYDDRWVTLTRTFDGMHRLDGMLGPLSAHTLQAALTPLLRATSDSDERSLGQRRADALTSLATLALNTGELPEVGGERPHVTVTTSWETLTAQLEDTLTGRYATLSSGEPVSPATARMLACDAGIIPAVLTGSSELLDLGRKTPIWTTAQRRALNLEGPGCRWPGCHTGAGYCHAHHITHWSHHGPTDVRNGVNLCSYHHHLIHRTNWQITKDHHNKIKVWRT
jgi:hypothetical protein